MEQESVNQEVDALTYCGSNDLVGVVAEGHQLSERRIVNLRTGKVLGQLTSNDGWDQLQLSRDGTQALSSSTRRDGSATLWDVASGTIVASRKLPGTGKPGLAFTSDGEPLAILAHNNVFGYDNGEPKNRLRITNVATGEIVHEVVEDRDIAFLGFSPDSELIAYSTFDRHVSSHNPGVVVVRKFNTGEEIFRTNFDSERPGHAQLSAAGQIMAVDGNDDWDQPRNHALAVWDLTTGKRVDPDRSGHRGAVRSLAFNTEGTSIASASPDGSVRLHGTRNHRDGEDTERRT